jgi:hypothetical protein
MTRTKYLDGVMQSPGFLALFVSGQSIPHVQADRIFRQVKILASFVRFKQQPLWLALSEEKGALLSLQTGGMVCIVSQLIESHIGLQYW